MHSAKQQCSDDHSTLHQGNKVARDWHWFRVTLKVTLVQINSRHACCQRRHWVVPAEHVSNNNVNMAQQMDMTATNSSNQRNTVKSVSVLMLLNRNDSNNRTAVELRTCNSKDCINSNNRDMTELPKICIRWVCFYKFISDADVYFKVYLHNN